MTFEIAGAQGGDEGALHMHTWLPERSGGCENSCRWAPEHIPELDGEVAAWRATAAAGTWR